MSRAQLNPDALEGTKTDHLLLLVGGNPLPNTVAGKLLLASGGKVTLVHSCETADVAQRLRTWLKGQGVGQVDLTEVEESSPISIVGGVFERLKAINTLCVGLNYTGGTKAMSVHAYRSLEQWANKRRQQGNDVKTVFSYLDARTLQMVFDPADSANSHSEYVGLAVQLNLVDLLSLHGWRLKHDPTSQPILAKTAKSLITVHAQQDTATAWGQWLQAELFSKATSREKIQVSCPRSPNGQECIIERPTQKWLSKGTLKSISVQWPSATELQAVTENMKSELCQTASLCLGDAAKTCGYDEPEDLCKWLNGLWLESALLQVLRDCATANSLHDVSMNLEPASGANNPTGFEFDVVAMRGYQLFAFSCSTATQKGLLKLKLFEAYIRARQLGGDEARVALVCCSNDPEGLEHEMRRDVDPEGRIRVFGRKDLADLDNQVAQWIQSQIGEEG